LRLERVTEAHAVLHQVATSDPTLWRAWNALAQTFDSAREWEQARASYEQALWAAPDAARIHNNLGVSLLRAGAAAAAIDQFGKALELAPGLAIAQTNLRLALAFEGRYLEALAGVPERSLPEALNNVGYIALVRGDHARAEAYFLRALEASPSFFEPAWRNLQYLSHLSR
jgi:Flp pilus assembly protein TadD